jgi:hypothetical protein
MSDPILIIDNHVELLEIEKQYKELKNAPLILISTNFTLEQLNSYSQRGYSWFDEKITLTDAEKMGKEISHILWNWFLDKFGNDISVIEGCSFGISFASSLEILINSLLRYQVGLKYLIESRHKVYYTSNTEDLFIDSIAALSHEIGFKLKPVATNISQNLVTFGKYKSIFDAGMRKRDLQSTFRTAGFKEKLAAFVLHNLQRKKKKEKRILFMPAGKLDQYFDDVNKTGNSGSFNWVMPLTNSINLSNYLTQSLLYYHFSAIKNNEYKEVTNELVLRLEENVKKCNISQISDLIIKAMRKHTFPYFKGALAYFYSVTAMIKKVNPDVVLLSADTYENYLIVAQSAKLQGITTALIPHGLSGWGYKELRFGRFRIFDYYFSFGQVDFENYRHASIPDTNIISTSFPYLEKFIPIHKKTNKFYKKALILSPDYSNISPSEKVSSEYKFYQDVIKLLNDLNIEIVGIKSRHSFQFQNLGGLKDCICIDGQQIQLLTGYTEFPEAVNNADFVVGPVSTAIVEANLLGKDYYVYHHIDFLKTTHSILPAIFNYVNTAYDMKILKQNIIKKVPYKKKCSVQHIIKYMKFNSKSDLYHEFENSIETLLSKPKIE